MSITESDTRTCYRCRQERPDTQFIKKKNGTFYGMCSPCLSEVLAGGSTGRKTRLPHTAVDRVCYLCRRRLPNREFTLRSIGTYFSACKECNKNVFAHRRRARLLAVGGSFTTKEWLDLLSRHPTCPRCHRRWEDIPLPRGRKSAASRDHIIPITRTGSSNGIANIQPLCYSCNSKKGNRSTG
jgi:5-methylcytosine-specific restriction endonuclease McrA